MKTTKKLQLSIATLALTASASLWANEFPVTFNGFVSNGYLKSDHYNYLADTEDGSFEFAELGINATWSPFNRASVRGQLFAFELGQYGNYDPLLDYLFIDYSFNQMIGVRAGRIKRPNGIYTEIQDIDIARTSILLPIGMYDQRYRDFSASLDGASIYGSFSLGNSQSIDYTAYYGMTDMSPDGGIGAFAETAMNRFLPGAKVTELTSDLNQGIQLWWNTPLSGLRFGTSISQYEDIEIITNASFPMFVIPDEAIAGTPYFDLLSGQVFTDVPLEMVTTAEVTSNRYSIEYFLNEWTFVSEVEISKTDTTDTRTIGPIEVAPGTPFEITQPTTADSSKSLAYYLSASRRFLGKFEGGITHTRYYGNKDSKSDPSRFNKDWQLSLRYDATSYWSLKAEYHLMEGTNRLFNQNNQNPVLDETDWNLFALKSTFSF